MDVDTLIKNGTHQWCPTCRAAIIPVAARMCQRCTSFGPPPETVQPTPKQPSSRTFNPPTPGSTTIFKTEELGELSRFEDLSLWIVAAGKPITQGSMRAVAAGVAKHSNGPALHAWRDTITKEALRVVEGKWRKLNIPVRLDVVLTLPPPKTLPAWLPLTADVGTPRVPPMTPPDVDKLLRAVQDALSPQDNKKKGEAVKGRDRRFQLLTDDSRIIDSSVRKTYARPRHTHSWALDYPGAVIRIAPVGQGIAPLPETTLMEPADFPEQAKALERAVRSRAGGVLLGI